MRFALMISIFTSALLMAQNADDAFTTTLEGDWMPKGFFNTVTGTDSWGPNMNDVRIARFSDEATDKFPFFLAEYGQLQSFLVREPGEPAPIWPGTDCSDWRNSDWVREQVLSVGEYFSTRGYTWASRHLPYLWNGVRGMDCSNYTAAVYNYAIGYRMSSGIRTQAGQTGTTQNYDTPNEQSQATRDGLHRAGGKLIRFDGTVDGQNSNADFLSCFDSGGNLAITLTDADLEAALRPGDLLFFSWGWENDLQRVRHAAIWTGKRIGNGVDEIPASYVNGGSEGDWVLLQSGSGVELADFGNTMRQKLWGARRVINDHNDPTEFLNSSFNQNGERTSHYLSNRAFSHANNIRSKYIEGAYVLNRKAGQNTYQAEIWVDPSGYHKGHSEPLTGLAQRWGWMFATDSDTLYKLSYVSNTGTWEGGVIHWQTEDCRQITALTQDDQGLILVMNDGSLIHIDLAGNAF